MAPRPQETEDYSMQHNIQSTVVISPTNFTANNREKDMKTLEKDDIDDCENRVKSKDDVKSVDDDKNCFSFLSNSIVSSLENFFYW